MELHDPSLLQNDMQHDLTQRGVSIKPNSCIIRPLCLTAPLSFSLDPCPQPVRPEFLTDAAEEIWRHDRHYRFLGKPDKGLQARGVHALSCPLNEAG